MPHEAAPPRVLGQARDRLPGLVGDLRQLASAQRIILGDGPDAGQKLISFSTGGGLEFQVKEEGSLDLRSLHFRGMSVGWRHPSGDRGNPQRALTGALVTCGLENVRAPRDGLPQHGSLALSPVRLLAVGEDWQASEPHLFVTGEIVHPMPGGAVCRITRRITAPIGGTRLVIDDRIENISATPAEVMLLYHVNFGFPVAAPGCTVRIGDRRITGIDGAEASDSPGMPECHRMPRNAPVILERPAAADWQGLRVRLEPSGDSLPFLQTWRDARPGRNILAIEPCNCDLQADGTSGPGTLLNPGSSLQCSLALSFS